MTRLMTWLVGALGLGLVLPVALSYRGEDTTALVLVLLVGAGLLAGLLELDRVAAALDGLDLAFRAFESRVGEGPGAAPAPVRGLLEATLHRRAAAWPQPVFAPYLVGLLVMLGLVGTFLGLVQTLGGARAALATTSDIDAMRAALLSPLGGLSRAFGTSLAGVAGSAALGLAAVVGARRQRFLQLQLERWVAGPLASQGPDARQLAAIEAMAKGSEALPRAAEALNQAVERMAALETNLARAQQQQLETQATQLSQLDRVLRDNHQAQLEAQAAAVSGAGEVLNAQLQTQGQALVSSIAALSTTLRDEQRVSTRDSSTALQDAVAGLSSTLAADSARQLDLLAQSATTLQTLGQDLQAATAALHDDMSRSWRDGSAEIQQRIVEGTERVAIALREVLAPLGQTLGEHAALAIEGQLERTGQLLEDQRALQQAWMHEVERVRTEALRGGLESTAEALAQWRAQGEAQTAALQHHVEAQAAALQHQVEAMCATLEQLDAQASGRAGDLQQSFARTASALDSATRGQAEALATLATRSAEQLERSRQHTDEHLATLAAQVGQAMASQQQGLVELEERLTTAREVEGARLAALATQVGQAVASQHAAMVDLEERLAVARSDEGMRLAESLRTAIEGPRRELDGLASLLNEVVLLLGVGGGELTLAAELLVRAVDRYREGSERWFDQLGRLDGTLRELGHASVDQLAEYLDQTRDAVDHSLQFQQELFAELQTLRGEEHA
ncbi:MAG: hypothetical protein ABIJ09_22465 [Pseudomonadota bacterium]